MTDSFVFFHGREREGLGRWRPYVDVAWGGLGGERKREIMGQVRKAATGVAQSRFPAS